jgi:NDP-sugar pyrophosphorylase family protein
MIKDYVADGERWGVPVSYVEETDGLLGTGGAVRLAVDREVVGDHFFVLYGDSYLQVHLRRVDADFERRNLPALMTVFENDGRWDKSNVVLEGEMITRYEKECLEPPAAMRYIDYGLSELRADVVRELVPTGRRHDLADLFSSLSRQGRLGGFEVGERFYEVGSPEGIQGLDKLLKNRRGRQPESS